MVRKILFIVAAAFLVGILVVLMQRTGIPSPAQIEASRRLVDQYYKDIIRGECHQALALTVRPGINQEQANGLNPGCDEFDALVTSKQYRILDFKHVSSFTSSSPMSIPRKPTIGFLVYLRLLNNGQEILVNEVIYVRETSGGPFIFQIVSGDRYAGYRAPVDRP